MESTPKRSSNASRPRLGSAPALAALLLAGTAACSTSDDSFIGTNDPPASDPDFEFLTVDNGFGQLLPHVVAVPDASGQPILQELRTVSEVVELVRRGQPVLPVEAFPEDAILPDGTPGNHFFLAQFTAPVDPNSECFTNCGGSLPCDIEQLEVITFDPATQEAVVVPTRVFIGGWTRNAAGELEEWAKVDPSSGELRLTVDEAEGFPGAAEPQLPNAAAFAAPESILIVMDSDDDLSTLEAFPATESLQLVLPPSIAGLSGQLFGEPGRASTSVGLTAIAPSLVREAGVPMTTPLDGDVDVDGATTIEFAFTEAIQPFSLGDTQRPLLSAGLSITQGGPNFPTSFPLTVAPLSAYDLTRYTVTPAFPFNGLDPDGQTMIPGLAEVEVVLPAGQMEDLVSNFSSDSAMIHFVVAPGASITNAPVVPESILISRGGSRPGLSVLDLNGFGQSTGNPASSLPFPLEGESRFPFDPNVTMNPTVRPLLNPGTTSVDGGSAGAFTLTLDANLNSVLAGHPILSDASDAQYGAALDTVFRNSPPPFGCQAGGGNVCALDGLKTLGQNPDVTYQPGFPNLVSFAPHPNPPRLNYPPACVAPFIAGNEPTQYSAATNVNLLMLGNPFPVPAEGLPPTGLFNLRPSAEGFYGPSFGQTDALLCEGYGVRQQIGQFLYIADRSRNEVVVLNSNRMLPVERISMSDPTSLALSPNLDLLAVTNMATDTVTFIDVNPASATFHTVIGDVAVGAGPRGIAFDPLDEDILVCNETDNTISVISALTLVVRKTVPSRVSGPFELAITPRMEGFFLRREVYFAYIIGRDGRVALFESGPSGVNGIGYDDTIGFVPFEFKAPRAIVVDAINLDASVYIAYEGPVDPNSGVAGPLGVGAVSRLRIESGLQGPQILTAANAGTPTLRDLAFSIPVTLSQADGAISGIPTSLAFDELYNLAEYPAPTSANTSGSGARHNGKATIRETFPDVIVNTNEAMLLFAAVPGADVIDPIQVGVTGLPRLDTNPYLDGVQSIPVPDLRFLTGYFSQ